MRQFQEPRHTFFGPQPNIPESTVDFVGNTHKDLFI